MSLSFRVKSHVIATEQLERRCFFCFCFVLFSPSNLCGPGRPLEGAWDRCHVSQMATPASTHCPDEACPHGTLRSPPPSWASASPPHALCPVAKLHSSTHTPTLLVSSAKASLLLLMVEDVFRLLFAQKQFPKTLPSIGCKPRRISPSSWCAWHGARGNTVSRDPIL